MSNIHYQFLSHIDAPKRFLTLTLDECVFAGLSCLLLIVTHQKIVAFLFGVAVMSGLRFIKKGQGPRFLLVLAYWYLPDALLKSFLPRLPASYLRIYIA